MKIYIDLFFLFNIIMDFMIILGTSIILKRNSNLIRIIISSLIGGFSSILLFGNINKILIEVISIIVMMLISFGYKGIKYVLRNIFYMYLLSTLIGGIIYLFNVKVSNNIVINYFIIIVISSLVLILYIKENRRRTFKGSDRADSRHYAFYSCADLLLGEAVSYGLCGRQIISRSGGYEN